MTGTSAARVSGAMAPTLSEKSGPRMISAPSRIASSAAASAPSGVPIVSLGIRR